MTAAGRELLTAPEAERAFVGALLHAAPAAVEALPVLVDDDDLTDPRLVTVVAAARRIVDAGGAPDPVTVVAELRARGELERLRRDEQDPLPFLYDLLTGVPMPANARFYATAILEAALRRRAGKAGRRLVQAAETGGLESLLALLSTEPAAVEEVRARLAPLAAGEGVPT